MKPLMKWAIVVALLMFGVAAAAGAAWYRHDRAGMLTALCAAGLPNFSRPTVVKPRDLGCKILGPRRRVSGVLLTGFEASNLIESDLPDPAQGGGFTGNTWWTPNQVKGGDERLDRQLAQPIGGLCQTGLASVVAYGWATETPGTYGHLGMYAREFFVDDVEKVGPPPAAVVQKMRRRWSEAGLRGCS